MTGTGRPLRFMALLVGGWIALRIVQLWPAAGPIRAIVAALAPPVAAATIEGLPTTPPLRVVSSSPIPPQRYVIGPVAIPPASAGEAQKPDPMRIALALAGLVRFGPAEPIAENLLHGPVRVRPDFATAPRFAGSGWMIVRGGGAGAPFAPQLGGSQAGARLTYAVGDSRRFALAARFSSALGSPQREAAIGINWRPTALPVRLVAEQRIGIEHARGGPAIGLIGGIGPRSLAAGFTLEAYAQAGAIARGGVEGYADGAIRLARPVATLGPARIELGLGAWGGAQRGAARLDIGPAASLALPAAGRSLRLSLEWRQRVAGGARPGSGPALSLGTDF